MRKDDEEDTLIKTTKKIPDLLLAAKWDLDTGVDPTGWWISEKLDGVRVYYDGESNTFTSRLGNLFTPPAWFLESMYDLQEILDRNIDFAYIRIAQRYYP